MRIIPRCMDTEHEVIDEEDDGGLRVLAHTLYNFTALIGREYTMADEDRIEGSCDGG